jgi:hypothetical protein
MSDIQKVARERLILGAPGSEGRFRRRPRLTDWVAGLLAGLLCRGERIKIGEAELIVFLLLKSIWRKGDSSWQRGARPDGEMHMLSFSWLLYLCENSLLHLDRLVLARERFVLFLLCNLFILHFTLLSTTWLKSIFLLDPNHTRTFGQMLHVCFSSGTYLESLWLRVFFQLQADVKS